MGRKARSNNDGDDDNDDDDDSCDDADTTWSIFCKVTFYPPNNVYLITFDLIADDIYKLRM